MGYGGAVVAENGETDGKSDTAGVRIRVRVRVRVRDRDRRRVEGIALPCGVPVPWWVF